jgi:L-ascorbate metabolism protein UlaG (beta-lactamase superfamily)
LLVEIDGARVLFDPGAFSSGFEQLTDLTAVVITHQHADHVDAERLPALLAANPGARLLAEPETVHLLRDAAVEAEPLRPDDEIDLGGVPLRGAGGHHAVIHPDLPGVGNVGMLLGRSTAEGGSGLLLHPGDSYDVAPSDVDVLALPLWAPWSRTWDMVDYLRAVSPRVAVPVHEGPLQPPARGIYLTHATNLAPAGTRLVDLAGAGAIDPLAS